MDEKRPSRRKDKDNPYTMNVKDGRFYIMFNNIDNETVTVEVSEDVYALFNTFELEDLALMNEFDRHSEHSELGEQELARRAEIEHTIDDIVAAKIEKETLMAAVDSAGELFCISSTVSRITKLQGLKNAPLRQSSNPSIIHSKN